MSLKKIFLLVFVSAFSFASAEAGQKKLKKQDTSKKSEASENSDSQKEQDNVHTPVKKTTAKNIQPPKKQLFKVKQKNPLEESSDSASSDEEESPVNKKTKSVFSTQMPEKKVNPPLFQFDNNQWQELELRSPQRAVWGGSPPRRAFDLRSYSEEDLPFFQLDNAPRIALNPPLLPRPSMSQTLLAGFLDVNLDRLSPPRIELNIPQIDWEEVFGPPGRNEILRDVLLFAQQAGPGNRPFSSEQLNDFGYQHGRDFIQKFQDSRFYSFIKKHLVTPAEAIKNLNTLFWEDNKKNLNPKTLELFFETVRQKLVENISLNRRIRRPDDQNESQQVIDNQPLETLSVEELFNEDHFHVEESDKELLNLLKTNFSELTPECIEQMNQILETSSMTRSDLFQETLNALDPHNKEGLKEQLVTIRKMQALKTMLARASGIIYGDIVSIFYTALIKIWETPEEIMDAMHKRNHDTFFTRFLYDSWEKNQQTYLACLKQVDKTIALEDNPLVRLQKVITENNTTSEDYKTFMALLPSVLSKKPLKTQFDKYCTEDQFFSDFFNSRFTKTDNPYYRDFIHALTPEEKAELVQDQPAPRSILAKAKNWIKVIKDTKEDMERIQTQISDFPSFFDRFFSAQDPQNPDIANSYQSFFNTLTQEEQNEPTQYRASILEKAEKWIDAQDKTQITKKYFDLQSFAAFFHEKLSDTWITKSFYAQLSEQEIEALKNKENPDYSLMLRAKTWLQTKLEGVAILESEQRSMPKISVEFFKGLGWEIAKNSFFNAIRGHNRNGYAIDPFEKSFNMACTDGQLSQMRIGLAEFLEVSTLDRQIILPRIEGQGNACIIKD